MVLYDVGVTISGLFTYQGDFSYGSRSHLPIWIRYWLAYTARRIMNLLQ